MQSKSIFWWTWVVSNTKCWSWFDLPNILAYILSHFFVLSFDVIQASQIVEGCELSCFYPMLQNNHLNLTFLIAGPTVFVIFCFEKKAWNNSLSLWFHPQVNVLLVTGHLGSRSLLFSTLRLPSHCLVWLAFPSSSSLPSFHYSLQPLFFTLDSPIFLLFGQSSFSLFYSSLFAFGQTSF